MVFSCHGLAVGAWCFPVMTWQWGHGVFLSWPGSGGMVFSCHGLAVGHGVFLSWPGSGAWTKYLNRNRSDNGSLSEKVTKSAGISRPCSVVLSIVMQNKVVRFLFCFCFVFRF